MKTSISDNELYPSICELAAKTDEYFSKFKSLPRYTDILEHVTYEEGLEYIQQFFYNDEIIKNIDKFKINDRYGSPRTYDFKYGTFSPTTLRYIKILNDLMQLKLNDTTIVEIGCGYGGQYTTLRQMIKPKTYIFIDLPPVLSLIKKYISELELDDIDLIFVEPDKLIEINADLIISNYAFSECNTAIQDAYMPIVNNSKHGYMIYNNMEGYTSDEFIAKTKHKVHINKEIPQTHPRNVLLTW